MTALIRAELMALRTLRSTYAVAAAAILLAAGITWADMADGGTTSLDSTRELRDALVMASGLVSALFVALFAALRTAGEYRHGTIAQRALASPHRGRMLAARLVTYSGLSGLISAAAFGASYLIAGPVLESKHLALTLGSSDVLRIAGEVVAGSTLFGMLGVAVGSISRSQAAATIVVFGTFLAEKLLSGLIGPVHDYLPYALLNSLLDLEGTLAPSAAGLALAGVAAAIATTAGLLLKHRDVI
jgi:ABC-2 type transport system permease protein